MRQADASDVCESTAVITSPAAPQQPELSAENRQHLSVLLEPYNSFADMIRAADRVPSSEFERGTRMMS
eukprot:5195100-Pyramimonas_sp.AAC.1